MTYDDWKGMSDRDEGPQPERSGWCHLCLHWDDSCDCPCCNEGQEPWTEQDVKDEASIRKGEALMQDPDDITF